MSPVTGPPVLPMMAALGEMPSGAGWSYEMKWDGIRVIAEVDDGVCRLWSRNSRDVSGGYPELIGLAEAPGLRLPAVLDGEIVTLDENGAPSFGLLQRRMHVRDPRHLRHLITEVPVSVRLFDLLRFDGKWLLEATYDDRRGLLDSLEIGDPFWETPPALLRRRRRRWTCRRRPGSRAWWRSAGSRGTCRGAAARTGSRSSRCRPAT